MAGRGRAESRVFMRPRHVITIAMLLVVAALVASSFVVNVMRPHTSGAMEGMQGGTSSGSVSTSGGMTSSGGLGANGSGGQTGSRSPVPGTLAGVSLGDVIKGGQAKMHIEELHGQSLGNGTDQAWLAHYGDSQATLWVTRAEKKADAASLMDRMTAAIARGGSPFTNPRRLEGVKGYRLDGMGQQHFYFIYGHDVLWLAIAPELAEQGYRDLLAHTRRVPRGTGG